MLNHYYYNGSQITEKMCLPIYPFAGVQVLGEVSRLAR